MNFPNLHLLPTRPVWLFSLVLAWTLIIPTTAIHAQDSAIRYGGDVPAEVDTIYERGLTWLTERQLGDGSWRGSGHQSGPGVDGICLMAYLATGEDPNFGRWANPIRQALRQIILSQDETTGYIPNSMYHHGFALLALSEAYGVVDEELLWQDAAKRGPRLAVVLQRAIDCAASSQKKNRFGGWRYSPDATDADTSVSGAVLMGLLGARNAGLDVPDATVDGSLEYFRRCTSRDGSVAYSGGFGMGESMNRSCIATLVAAVSKQKDEEKYLATVQHITSRLEHREGSYPEYYFRYYMAQALFQCDYESWQKWNAQTIRFLSDTQAEDGSFSQSAYSTGMSLLALALNYRFLPIYER